LEVRVDSGSWVTLARTVSMGNFAMVCGASYNLTNFLNGSIVEMLTAGTRFDDTAFNNIKTYVNSRYALSL
jgi:hypothetical protein